MGTRRPGAFYPNAVVESVGAAPVLCEWLEDRPEPLSEPGPVDDLAVAARMRRLCLAADAERHRLEHGVNSSWCWMQGIPRHDSVSIYRAPHIADGADLDRGGGAGVF